MIYIYSSKKAVALGLKDNAAWLELLPLNLKASSRPKPEPGDQAYLDISGLSQADLKKTLGQFKKSYASSFWGVIDPKGVAKDPALFFFEGASDYIGPALVKAGIDKKRFTAALSRPGAAKSVASKEDAPAAKPEEKRKTQKLPTGKFGGWKSIATGTVAPFFFLFVSLSGKTKLRSMVDEELFTLVKNRLRDVLWQAFAGADALLWMETEDNSLFLVPPLAANGRAAVEAGLKLVLNSRLISIEKLGLQAAVDFTVAMHYGKTLFRPPGKTGSVVSEPVNYIFHLGVKKTELGRFSISADVSEEAIPEGLLDLFTQAGTFEGIHFRHSRRFIYS